jgi:hypothetical protein
VLLLKPGLGGHPGLRLQCATQMGEPGLNMAAALILASSAVGSVLLRCAPASDGKGL